MPRRGKVARLAPPGVREVNATYYSAEPADYFQQRWLGVVLAAGDPEGRDRLLQAPLKVDGLEFSRGAAESDDPSGQKRAVEHFVISEVEQLSHHIGESLLRLYLAHRDIPECPAAELVQNEEPGRFKQAVAARFQASRPSRATIRREVALAYYGSETRKPYSATVPSAKWTEALDAIETYQTYFARRFLDDAPLFNAAKHGLALSPGEARIELKETPLKAAGPAIRYLRDMTDQGGRRVPAIGTHWVRIGRELAIAWVGIELMRSIWSTARFRYTAKRGRDYGYGSSTSCRWSVLWRLKTRRSSSRT